MQHRYYKRRLFNYRNYNHNNLSGVSPIRENFCGIKSSSNQYPPFQTIFDLRPLKPNSNITNSLARLRYYIHFVVYIVPFQIFGDYYWASIIIVFILLHCYYLFIFVLNSSTLCLSWNTCNGEVSKV